MHCNTHTGTHTATHRDDEAARHELDRLIFQELTLGSFTPAARLWLESRISLFCHVKGCDAVVLACTELGALRASCSNALQPATTHCNALHHAATEVGGDGGEDGG
eukprot:CAMPEP_0173078904 /NCGR_PEP_ID=MMETSP1102-20130122/14608_1 /TAXON_ID=49646 /ORGANISM="Geminigera sp., Strain Caron Lab Isolate" /LENGTH=105 /DNA_ID=CAMNT_0013950689 /DNA_START=288 /DNA_END=601 /DNA_ORIENTATION=-